MATDTQECAVTAIEKHSGNYEVGYSSLTSPKKHAKSSTILQHSLTAQQTHSSPTAILALLSPLCGFLISIGIAFVCVNEEDVARVATEKPCTPVPGHIFWNDSVATVCASWHDPLRCR
jgi:hypothetical protein